MLRAIQEIFFPFIAKTTEHVVVDTKGCCRIVIPYSVGAYPGKAGKAIYRDPDGNELGYGGPVAAAD